jgi:hypothetical protein
MPPRLGAVGLANEPDGRRLKKPPFSGQRILDAVVGTSNQSIKARLPAFFADSSVEAAWRQWAANVPHRLQDVPTEHRALPLRMPMKYMEAPGDSGLSAEAVERPQVELMTYKNPGGQHYSKDELLRDAVAGQSRAVLASELSVGCSVAIKRDASDPREPPGYDTPFYIADVLEIQTSGAGSSSTGGAEVKSLVVNYRMPAFNGAFCDDPRRPFKPVCVAMHEWGSGCERRHMCVSRRPQGQTTSRLVATVDVQTVFEFNVPLVVSGALSAKAKRLLAQTEPSWAEALGVPSASGAEESNYSKKPTKARSNKKRM